MHFKYVIFSLSALLIQVINGQNAGSSFGCSCCCDTSISSPVSFSFTQELGSLSGGNAGLSDSIISCGNNNQSEKSNSTGAAFTVTGEEESSCDSAAERYRRARHSSSDGLRCTTNLLKARLALAAATAKAAASNAQDDASVVATSVPVPAELTPPRLLHKQAIIGLSLSPCLINVPAPSCNCSSFGPSSSVSANAVTISQKLGNPNGNNAANISNCRCNNLPRPLPPKPPSVGTCTTPIRVLNADGGSASPLAAIVAARLAQHRLLTGQQLSSGQCLCSVNLPAPSCDCSSCGSKKNVNVAIPSRPDFLVTSISSEPPPIILVETDVALLGNINVCGNLPFVSAVQFDGSYDSVGSGSVSFGCDSEPVTQGRSNNAVSSAATIDSCRSPDVPRAPSTLAAAADVPDADELESPPTINPAAALYARLAQQRSLTTQQSNIEQCPRCISPSLPNCSCFSSGSISSVITPGSGSLGVTSTSSESPGLDVDTDVALSGNLDVCGTLPFASAVQFQGLYDTSGSGSVSFGCNSKPEQTLENLNGNNAASTTTINSCRSSQSPKYIPRTLPTLTTVAAVGDLPTKTANADEKQTSATNMAALVSARLAQHRLLTGQAPDCDCRSSVSPNLFTPSNGVPVTSISPEPPGIDVDANIGLFGNLNVSGDLPFQSAVQFQGLYETSGSGTVSFGCGDSVAIKQKLENPSVKNTTKSNCQ